MTGGGWKEEHFSSSSFFSLEPRITIYHVMRTKGRPLLSRNKAACCSSHAITVSHFRILLLFCFSNRRRHRRDDSLIAHYDTVQTPPLCKTVFITKPHADSLFLFLATSTFVDSISQSHRRTILVVAVPDQTHLAEFSRRDVA